MMADTNQQELITQFTSVTGIDADRAKFYLESAAWDLQLAMASFYEEGDGGEGPEHTESGVQAAKGTSSSRFTTFSSMSTGEEDSDEGEAFYAGGSETSGQQILGPPKKKSDHVVEHLMKSAKEHGAEVAESSSGTSQKVKNNRQAFKGTGYKLGETDDASEAVQGEIIGGSGPRQVDVVLKLWKNGFSVDNEPMRDFNDPANKEFLDSISKGEIPRELIRMARGGEVNLNMEDHRAEDYVKPKQSLKAFSGEGHMLGSPSPGIVNHSKASPGATPSSPAVPVDISKPITSIQIRLADGSRLVAKFNHSHSVDDIRNHIIRERPQYAGSQFVLMTTFPNKELTEEKATLAEAKLLNAVIVQKLK